MFRKIIDFIKHGVWEDGKDGWAIRPFKIALYTVKGIGEHDIFLRSASLTYYTLMSIVPIAALIFGFMKGFGFDQNLWEWIYAQLPQYSETLDYLKQFVDNMLVKTRGGLLAAVGIVVLFWSVIKVFNNVEKAFNSIWEVRQQRSIARKLSDYLVVVIVAPILLLAASSLSSLVRSMLEPWLWTWLLDVAFALAEMILMWLLFAFVYWVMPNTRVRFKGAVIAALIAGTAFWLFQKLYFLVQGELSSYNAVYGTFAAIPLLLVWLQTSWLLVLIGAELSFAYQNIDRYELERESTFMSMTNKRKILLGTMVVIVKHFVANDGPVTSEDIANELNLPVRSIRDVVYELEQAGLVVPVKTQTERRVNQYVPARDVHNLTVFDIIDGVENENTTKLDVGGLPAMKKVSKLLDQVRDKTKDAGMETKLTELL